jgi:hypothetical protein
MTDQPATLAAALAQLQGRLPRVTKDATANAGAYTYKYATLAAIHEALLPLMAALGLAWICKPTLREDGRFVLAYTLLHAPRGEREDGDYPLPGSGGPQQLGSAITYGRRYLITAVTGIVAEDDDDGRAAQDSHEAAVQAWQPPARPHTRKADRHRADRDGPLPDDQWTTPGAATGDQPGTIDARQLGTITALMRELGAKDQADRRAMVLSLLNLPETIASQDLSYSQAESLITGLRAKKAEVTP